MHQIAEFRVSTPDVVKALILAAFALAVSAPTTNADEKTPPKTVEVKAKDLTLKVPETWKQKPEVREPRIAEFQIPPADGDKDAAEFVVFYFGTQGAGDVQANVQRWVGQFDVEGRKVKIFSGESPQGKYTLVDLTGTYKKSIGAPILGQSKTLPGWRVLNVMLESKSGSYFLKIDGPEKTIAASEEPFRTSFGAKKASEKEQPAK